MSVLEEWWEDLRAHAIPPDASDKQVRDMRIAFLIGVRETIVFVVEREDAHRKLSELATEVNSALVEILEGLQ